MGVDAQIFAVVSDGTPLNQWGAELRARMRYDEPEPHDDGWRENSFAVVENYRREDFLCAHGEIEDGHFLIEWTTLLRYYGPDYERGPWPEIAALLEWLMARTDRVYYGGDTMGPDGWQQWTPERQRAMWAHWASPNGDNYRRTMSAFTAQLNNRARPETTD